MLLEPGVYFGAIDLHIMPNMSHSFKKYKIFTSFTEEYFGQSFYFNREDMTVTQLKTGNVYKIFDWDVNGITFEKIKI
jgi:hypothetical protein